MDDFYYSDLLTEFFSIALFLKFWQNIRVGAPRGLATPLLILVVLPSIFILFWVRQVKLTMFWKPAPSSVSSTLREMAAYVQDGYFFVIEISA